VGDFKKRFGSAVIIGPLVILLFLFLPPRLFLIFMVLVLGLAAFELASMAGSARAIAVLAMATLLPLYADRPGAYSGWLLCSPALYLLLKLAMPGQDRESLTLNNEIGRSIVVLLLSEVFLALPLFSMYRLKELDAYLPLALLLIIWSSDTAAYLVGKTMGRHKLAPLVSPKKTFEGLAGAMAGAALVTMLFRGRLAVSAAEALAIGGTIGILGQLGDMLESIAKRVCAKKDSSSLIPGHGGILDRMDSFLLTAPFLYLYLTGFTR